MFGDMGEGLSGDPGQGHRGGGVESVVLQRVIALKKNKIPLYPLERLFFFLVNILCLLRNFLGVAICHFDHLKSSFKPSIMNSIPLLLVPLNSEYCLNRNCLELCPVGIPHLLDKH